MVWDLVSTSSIYRISALINAAMVLMICSDIDYATPCGFCRQFMVEFGKETVVILTNSKREYKMMKLKELLPLSFGPEDLSKPRDGQLS